MNKKNKWTDRVVVTLLFLLAFIGTWLALSFGVPYFRLKMDPADGDFFGASLRHMAVSKSLACLGVGAIVALIPRVLGKDGGGDRERRL